jgi:hypothetical protein
MKGNGNKEKTNFRAKTAWKKFSKSLKTQQKTDPLTGSKLTKFAQVHHLDPYNYEDLSPQKYVALNPMSHNVIEFIFKARGGWRRALEEINKICQEMEKYQNDFKK